MTTFWLTGKDKVEATE